MAKIFSLVLFILFTLLHETSLVGDNPLLKSGDKAVDRCESASMSEAKEALINAVVEVLSAHRLAQNLPAGAHHAGLHAPTTLRVLPLYVLALIQRKAFRTGTSTRLADMCFIKSAPLAAVLRAVHPDLYSVHALEHGGDPPRLQLTAERINMDGAYLLDDGDTMLLYVCRGASAGVLRALGVQRWDQLPAEPHEPPRPPEDGPLHAFIEKLNEDQPYSASLLVIREDSPSKQLFTERLIEDRVESAFSYYEFLQHVKTQVK